MDVLNREVPLYMNVHVSLMYITFMHLPNFFMYRGRKALHESSDMINLRNSSMVTSSIKVSWTGHVWY